MHHPTKFPHLVTGTDKKIKTFYAYKGVPEQDPLCELRFKFAKLLTEISEVFDIEMFPDSKNWKTGMGLELLKLHYQIENNYKELSTYNFAYHFILVSNAREISKFSTKLLQQFAAELLKCKTISQYHSLRFEIATASLLSRHNLQFKKRESPDFELILNKQQSYFECTSCHVEKIAYDKQSKLVQTVRKKTRKTVSVQLSPSPQLLPYMS